MLISIPKDFKSFPTLPTSVYYRCHVQRACMWNTYTISSSSSESDITNWDISTTPRKPQRNFTDIFDRFATNRQQLTVRCEYIIIFYVYKLWHLCRNFSLSGCEIPKRLAEADNSIYRFFHAVVNSASLRQCALPIKRWRHRSFSTPLRDFADTLDSFLYVSPVKLVVQCIFFVV